MAGTMRLRMLRKGHLSVGYNLCIYFKPYPSTALIPLN